MTYSCMNVSGKDDILGETNYGKNGFEVPGGGVCVGMGTGWGGRLSGNFRGIFRKSKSPGGPVQYN